MYVLSTFLFMFDLEMYEMVGKQSQNPISHLGKHHNLILPTSGMVPTPANDPHQPIVLKTGVRRGDRDDRGPPSRPKVDDALRVLRGCGNSLPEVPKVTRRTSRI